MGLLRWTIPSAVLFIACGGRGGDSSSPSPSASEDERGALGFPPTAADYCVKQGYTLDLDTSFCKFPDGTSCEEWSFWRGECGQPFSYCNKHGGQVSAKKTEEDGGATIIEAICSLNGKQCKELD